QRSSVALDAIELRKRIGPERALGGELPSLLQPATSGLHVLPARVLDLCEGQAQLELPVRIRRHSLEALESRDARIMITHHLVQMTQALERECIARILSRRAFEQEHG